MRKIVRSRVPPEALRASRIREQRRKLADYYKQLPAERMLSRPPFDPELLYNSEVHLRLTREFQGRCAWCEQLIDTHEIGHYRPRGGAQFGIDRQVAPDYYGWFAYQWQNLLLVCKECNRAKSNWFPLHGHPAQIQCTWSEAQRTEKTLLLNPSADNPCEHLSIRHDGLLLPLTEKGHTTIEILQLNRAPLRYERENEMIDIIAELDQCIKARSSEYYFIQTKRPGVTMIFLNTLLRIVAGEYTNLRFKPLPTFARAFDAVLDSSLSADELMRLWSDFSFPLPETKQKIDWANVANKEKRRSLASQFVTGIRLQNFKSFEDFTLDFTNISPPKDLAPCVALVGENSTGKSSILQGICLTLMSRQQRTRLRLDYENYLQRDREGWQRSHMKSASITLNLEGGDTRMLTISDEGLVSADNDWPDFMVLAYGARRYFCERTRGTAVGKSLFYPTALLRDVTSELADKDDEFFASIARAMKEILSLEQGEFLLRDIHRNILVRAHGRDTPLSKMSDGYQSLFAMSLDIMFRMTHYWGSLEAAHGVVLIDEIETHLHPRWKIQVVSALRRAMPGVQFIFSTHDPLCLRGLTQHEVRVLFRDPSQQVVELSELPLVQGMDIEQLLTSDYFGLLSTLDGTLENLLNRYERTIQQTSRQQELIHDIERELSQYRALSGNPAQRAIAEGIARYVEQARQTPLEREKLHEDAVRMIVKRLQEAQR
ncbi:AAA family ATPase [Serratia surfactantfaciens]|uniref:AAA family ATPase n=1 Tax=Serratia surfactantfaciens TaxID=2741499 RepID=UPI000A051488|nr:AAA family ATPase [Serratia surfactantfaciens]